MKAFVLAAGIGSRLKPWTDFHPKALVEVDGKPMLQHVIENIIASGIHDIIVNVHHFAPQIIEFIDSHKFDASISVSDESGLLLDTGGAIRKATTLFNDEPVLVHNADILTDLPLERLVEVHNASHADATLLTAERNSSRRLVFDTSMQLRGWVNLSTGDVKPMSLELKADNSFLRSFNGIHVLSPRLWKRTLDYAAPETPFSIIDFYIASCNSARIRGFDMPADFCWWDVGKPDVLEQARKYYHESSK